MVDIGSRALPGPAKISQPLRGFEQRIDGRNAEKRLCFFNRQNEVLTKS